MITVRPELVEGRRAPVILEMIQEAAGILLEARVHRPQWTAEQLLAERLGCLPVDLYVEPPAVPSKKSVQFLSDIAARANGVPLQYLLGSADFYGREFSVGPGVFIPRPETEVLIDAVLNMLSIPVRAELVEARGGDSPVLVDVGTGSGAIAITLAKERPGLRPLAVERSSVALHFARRNALRHRAEVSFIQGDLLAGLVPQSVDCIVANLPYLNPTDALTWPRELAWEPWLALDGGVEGVALIEQLLAQAPRVLKLEGRVVLEIGMGQAEQVRTLAEENGFEPEKIIPDLAGLDRVMVLRWSNQNRRDA